MAINSLGTWEQKENRTRNMGTKAYLREQGTPKSKKYFREHGNTRKILLGTREHGPPREALIISIAFLSVHRLNYGPQLGAKVIKRIVFRSVYRGRFRECGRGLDLEATYWPNPI